MPRLLSGRKWTVRPEPDRKILEDAVRKAFPDHADELIQKAWWSYEGCWLFQFCGMTVGCEPDGYIHS